MKTSLLMVLLMAFFSVGFSSANAKTPTKDKIVTKTHTVTSSIKTVEAVPIRCQIQSISMAIIGNSNWVYNLLDECQFSATRLPNGGAVFVLSDCSVEVVNPDGSVVISHPDGGIEYYPAPST